MALTPGGDAVSVHRIRVWTERGREAVAVDVALPSGAPVGDLIPAILDMLGDHPSPDGTARGWRLDRPTGSPLSESMSLHDNGVNDGELLILVPDEAPALGLMSVESCREVTSIESPHGGVGHSPAHLACALMTGLSAVVLAWTGASSHPMPNLIVAAVGVGAGGAAAHATRYPTAYCMAVVTLCAAAGFLTVPSPPAAPNAFLAASAAFASALLALRLRGRPSRALSAAATFAGLLAVVTVASIPVVLAGAVLSAASLGLLALAPRVSVLAAGLGFEHRTDGLAVRADTGHVVLTGLVAGCAAGTVAGATTVASAQGESPIGAIAFPALVGFVLLMRARTYVDPARQLVLVAAGSVCGTASFVAFVVSHPQHAGWGCGGLIGIALLTGRHPRSGLGMSRALDRLEYLALAAVVPMTLWVGGVYAFVGEARPW